WRRHLRTTAEAHPGIVPVVKGNGYGFGNHRLARRVAWLGVDTVAVGTYGEVADVLPRCEADVLVLAPWRPGADGTRAYDPRVIHTVGRVADLETLGAQAPAGTRVVLEGLTSMKRHGLERDELAAAARALGRLRPVGL